VCSTEKLCSTSIWSKAVSTFRLMDFLQLIIGHDAICVSGTGMD
jgi:hypothetical protein